MFNYNRSQRDQSYGYSPRQGTGHLYDYDDPLSVMQPPQRRNLSSPPYHEDYGVPQITPSYNSYNSYNLAPFNNSHERPPSRSFSSSHRDPHRDTYREQPLQHVNEATNPFNQAPRPPTNTYQYGNTSMRPGAYTINRGSPSRHQTFNLSPQRNLNLEAPQVLQPHDSFRPRVGPCRACEVHGKEAEDMKRSLAAKQELLEYTFKIQGGCALRLLISCYQQVVKDNKWSRESSAFLDPYASLLPLVLYDEQDNPMVMGYDAYDVFDTVGKGTKKRKERGRGGNGAEWTNAPNEILMLGLIFEFCSRDPKTGITVGHRQKLVMEEIERQPNLRVKFGDEDQKLRKLEYLATQSPKYTFSQKDGSDFSVNIPTILKGIKARAKECGRAAGAHDRNYDPHVFAQRDEHEFREEQLRSDTVLLNTYKRSGERGAGGSTDRPKRRSSTGSTSSRKKSTSSTRSSAAAANSQSLSPKKRGPSTPRKSPSKLSVVLTESSQLQSTPSEERGWECMWCPCVDGSCAEYLVCEGKECPYEEARCCFACLDTYGDGEEEDLRLCQECYKEQGYEEGGSDEVKRRKEKIARITKALNGD